MAITRTPVPAPPQLHEQVFDSSGTWTPPPGVTVAWVTIFGAGAGGQYGGMSNTSNGAIGANGGSGGGSGGYMERRRVPVTPGTPITITIGAGGAGGTPQHGEIAAGGVITSSGANVNATNGGTTSFGSLSMPGGGSQPDMPMSHAGNGAAIVREGSWGSGGGTGARVDTNAGGQWVAGGGGSSGGSFGFGHAASNATPNTASAGAINPGDGSGGGAATSTGFGGTVQGGNGGDAPNGSTGGGGGGGGAVASGSTLQTHIIPGSGGKGANGRVVVEWVS